MSILTIWTARQPRSYDSDDFSGRFYGRDAGGRRILCGHHRGVNYCTAPPIARVDERDAWHAVALPPGLAPVDGLLNVYDWGGRARRRLDAGERPGTARRVRFPGAMAPRTTSLGARDPHEPPSGVQSYAPWESGLTAVRPVTVRCEHGHWNRIDVRTPQAP